MSLTNPDSVITVERLAEFWSQIRTPLDTVGADIASLLLNPSIPYGGCSTASGTQAKTVTVTPGLTELKRGQLILVYFENSNTAGSPTLNVNGLGAKSFVRHAANFVSATAGGSWAAGQTLLLRYDGNWWRQLTPPWPEESLTAPVDITSTVYKTDYVTSLGGYHHLYRVGRLVCLGLNFLAGANIGAATTLFTNAPAPMSNAFPFSIVADGGRTARMAVLANGNIVMDGGSLDSGFYYNGSVIYPSLS